MVSGIYLCLLQFEMQSEALERWVPSYLLLETKNDVCLYCGNQASHNEHLIPFSMLTASVRKQRGNCGLISRSCPSCNSVLSNNYFDTLDRRVDFVTKDIAKKFRKIRCNTNWTQREVSELSLPLRSLLEAKILAKQDFERRLMWPNVPSYIDLRENMYEKCKALHPQNRRLLEFIRPSWMWSE
jgi:hypothetical protein